MEVHNGGQCPSPTPQTSSPTEHDGSGTDNECAPVSMAIIQLDQMTFKENGQNQSTDVGGEDQMTDLDDNVGAQNIETINRIKDVEVYKSVQSEETQQKKRKRTKMNHMQIEIMENALRDQPDLQKKAGSIQLWADKLSLHGPEVTRSQLRNWLNNRKAKLARAAAKDAHIQSEWDDALTEKQTGSGPHPISDSPESLNDEDYDPSPSVPRRTQQKDLRGSVLKIRGTKTTQDTVVVPKCRFKRQAGHNVILTNNQEEEIGTGRIHLARGVWVGKNLEDLGLCVVDVNDIKLPKWTPLPHPTDAGATFYQAQMILRRMRILWNSSQLLLIQQQMHR